MARRNLQATTGFNPSLPAVSDPCPLAAEAMAERPVIDWSEVPLNKRTGSGSPGSRFLEVAENLLRYMEQGNSRSNACRLCGIDPIVPVDWRRLARDNPEKYPEYVWYSYWDDRIRGQVQQELVQEIISTAKSGRPNTWQAAAWYLERTDPENWGRRDKVEVESKNDKPLIQLNQVIISDDDAYRASRDLLGRLAAGRTVESIGPGARSEPAEDIEAT